MPFDQIKNFAYSTVAVAPTPSTTGTTLQLPTGDGTKFPTPPFDVVVWPALAQPLSSNSEIVRVTGISGDILTITRTQEGSSVRQILVGDQIAEAITTKLFTDLEAAIAAAAPLASPTFTGTPSAPTPTTGDNTTKIATTAFVTSAVGGGGGGGAPLNSPNFTGVPTAPTASPGTNSSQIATTNYTDRALTANAGGSASPTFGRTSTVAAPTLRDFVMVTDFGADPTGVSDSAPAFRAAGTALSYNGTIGIPQGTFSLQSTSGGLALPVPVGISGVRIVGFGRGATIIQLSATCPRFVDFNRTADYQTAQNVTIESLTVDGNNVTGFNGQHVLIGTQNGVSNCGQRLNVTNISIYRVTVINVLAGSPGIAARRVIGFVTNHLGTGEGTQTSMTDITCEDVNLLGGMYGFIVLATGSNSGVNIFYDRIIINRCKHDTLVPTTSFVSSANIQIGSLGHGGFGNFITNFFGKNSWDVGIELDAPNKFVIFRVTIEDCQNAAYLTTNFRGPLYPNAQEVIWRDCTWKGLSATVVNFAKFQMVRDSLATYPNTIPTNKCVYKDCSAYFNRATIGAGNSNGEIINITSGTVQGCNTLIIDGFLIVMENWTYVGAPTGFTSTPVGTGGTFAAATYFWKVSALVGTAESAASSEATATIVLNGSATLGWTTVSGATGYKIYRSTTTGGESGGTSLVATVGAVTTYTDTGTATSAGGALAPGSTWTAAQFSSTTTAVTGPVPVLSIKNMQIIVNGTQGSTSAVIFRCLGIDGQWKFSIDGLTADITITGGTGSVRIIDIGNISNGAAGTAVDGIIRNVTPLRIAITSGSQTGIRVTTGVINKRIDVKSCNWSAFTAGGNEINYSTQATDGPKVFIEDCVEVTYPRQPTTLTITSATSWQNTTGVTQYVDIGNDNGPLSKLERSSDNVSFVDTKRLIGELTIANGAAFRPTYTGTQPTFTATPKQ